MTTVFHLVRHAVHEQVGSVLVGRLPGVHLSAEGHEQARRLARHFAGSTVAAVLASPRERAAETAHAIAKALGLGVQTSTGFDELDAGSWQGLTFDQLADDESWTSWNAARSFACPPGGETFLELQARVVAGLMALCWKHPEGTVIVVSHAEPIRAAVLHVLGLGPDSWQRIEVKPASVSTVVIGRGDARLVALNAAPCAGGLQ